MGCGHINNKSFSSQNMHFALKPYPDDINGINHKVANSFNAFLKQNGANLKPLNKERPKLVFEIKESKPVRQQKLADSHGIQIQKFDSASNNYGDLFLPPISEKKSAEDSLSKYEDRSLIIPIPSTINKPRFSISVIDDQYSNNEE
jgi:hypothetical protein